MARWFCLVTSLLVCSSLASLAGGQERRTVEGANSAQTTAEITGIRVGFDGRYKVGLWTPVEVTVRGAEKLTAGQVSVIVPDGDGVPSRVWAPLAAEQTSALLYVRFGRTQGPLTLELRDGDRPVARRVFSSVIAGKDGDFPSAIAATRKVILTVGADAMGVDGAIDLLRQEASQRPMAVALSDVRQLPTQWYGYEGIDALVLSSSAAGILADWKPDSPQIAALDEWIRMGGRLVFCVGARGAEVLSGDSPWSRFAPGRLEQMIGLRETRALEAYAQSTTAVSASLGGEPPELRVPQLTDVQGIIEAREASLPWIVRTPRGFGQILFLAADLDRPPLSQWAERALLLARLLDFPPARSEQSRETTAVMHYGFNDVAGQLRSALDGFREVRFVPFWVVAALMVAYVLLIGPADYFLLRKVLRRTQWTWLTFSTLVIVVSLVAYGLAHYCKGDRPRVNQVDLIDVDAASGYVRGTSWLTLFSPRSEAFDLSLRARSLDRQRPAEARVLLSWLGLPGSALGGMDPGAAAPMFGAQQYDFAPQLDALCGVPIQVWSTKSFTARWNMRVQIAIGAELADEGHELAGSVSNPFAFPLANCILAYGNWAYVLETLAPGESLRLGPNIKQNELKTLLNERRIVTDQREGNYRQESRPYDRSSVDLAYILRAAMFYEAAGGQRYTGLSNGYQAFVDLSGLLGADRAILVAMAPADRRGADLLVDGQPIANTEDQHVTIYRFVLPVKKASDNH